MEQWQGTYDEDTEIDIAFQQPLGTLTHQELLVPHESHESIMPQEPQVPQEHQVPQQRAPVEFVRSSSVQEVLIPLRLNPPSIVDRGIANSKKNGIFNNKTVKKLVTLSHFDPSADTNQTLHDKNMIIQLKGLFHACDGDGDGFLYKSELIDCLRMTGFSKISDTLLNKYIVLNHEDNANSNAGIAKVCLDLFIDVTVGELATNGMHSHSTDNGSEVMGLVMKDIASICSKDLNDMDCENDDITLRSLHHFLSEIASPSTLNTHQYKKFMHALGLYPSNKHNEYMKLTSREREYGIQYDKLLQELLISK